ncbi:hypothetical protein AFLA_003510 [Aspergillus flavus NRRL3357]|nr:hypothetical protein AFLA_003510 [Aspergillus flavus NRRL3357]
MMADGSVYLAVIRCLRQLSPNLPSLPLKSARRELRKRNSPTQQLFNTAKHPTQLAALHQRGSLSAAGGCSRSVDAPVDRELHRAQTTHSSRNTIAFDFNYFLSFVSQLIAL